MKTLIEHPEFWFVFIGTALVFFMIGAVVVAIFVITRVRVRQPDEPEAPEHEGHGNVAIFDVLSHEVAEEDSGARVLMAKCHCGKHVGLRFAGHAACIIAKDICASRGVECPNTELKHGDNSP